MESNYHNIQDDRFEIINATYDYDESEGTLYILVEYKEPLGN